MADLAVLHMTEMAAPRAGRQVASAIAEASARTGVDFRYMVAKAGVESSFDPDAGAATSSARGLYQFIDSTWLMMVRRHGQDHGLGREAAAITVDRGGNPHVSDRKMRRHILALRDNPKVAALMAAEFARDNRALLAAEYGGAIGDTELYLAHFLGPQGAARFLNAWEQTPNRSAAALFPAAARANRPTFYLPGGRPRSLDQVHAYIGAKLAAYDPSQLMRAKADEIRDSVRQSAAGLPAALAVQMAVTHPAAASQPTGAPPLAPPERAARQYQDAQPRDPLPTLLLDSALGSPLAETPGTPLFPPSLQVLQMQSAPAGLQPFTTLSPETVLLLASLRTPDEGPVVQAGLDPRRQMPGR